MTSPNASRYRASRPPYGSLFHGTRAGGRLGAAALALVLIAALGSTRSEAAPGDLDVTFAGFGNGIVSNGFGVGGMAVQADGRIVVAGTKGHGFEVRRYLANGALDLSFDGDGIAQIAAPAGPDFEVTCVAAHTNGRIAVGGWLDSQPASFALAVVTSTGSIDPGFNITGWAVADFDNDTDQIQAVAFQPDGKILAAGRARINGDYDFAVVRYHSQGGPDLSFGGDGKVAVPFGFTDECYGMALQEDGKIVLVGSYDQGEVSQVAVARLHTDGSLDSSFNGDGRVYINIGSKPVARAVAIQSDGRIVLSGSYAISGTEIGIVMRLLPNGSPDSSFDGDGKVTNSDNSCDAVAVQVNGQIVVAGYHVSPSGDHKAAFHRLNADGSPDLTLNGGAVYVDLGSAVDRCNDVAVLLDGRVLGNCEHGVTGELVRIWPDGSFDAGGNQTVAFEDHWTVPGLPDDPVDGACNAMAIDNEGRIILAGEVTNIALTETDIAVTRLMPNGLVDTSFGMGGRAQLGFFQFDRGRAVAVQPDGKIVVAGHMENASVVDFMVTRFLPNGSEDGGFGFGGVNILDFLGGDDYGTAVAVAPDGKIVVAGTVSDGAHFVFGVARFNTDGTPDDTFDLDAKQLYEFTGGASHDATSVVVQPDGKIVVGGTVDGDFALVRFDDNGSVDGTFGIAGKIITDMGGDDRLHALALAPNGWLYAAGSRDVGGNLDFAIAQYWPHGALTSCRANPCDVWFTGKQFFDWGGLDAAFAVQVRSDGRVVAAGRGNEKFAWVQFEPTTPPNPVFGSTDFPGTADAARAVAFTGLDWIVTAGFARFNDDDRFAVARFWTTPGSIASTVDDTHPASGSIVRLRGSFPNPLSHEATISFDLAAETAVRLAVYDVAGRRVRQLVETRLPAGRHDVLWNGRDDRGRSVAAGVYHCRLEAGGMVQNRSLAVVK